MKITGIIANRHSPNVSMNLKCSACSRALIGDEKFCPQCGRELVVMRKIIPVKEVLKKIEEMELARCEKEKNLKSTTRA